ncbi:MAG: hypothetical protein R2794_07815 [Chitinophagales bacterium]
MGEQFDGTSVPNDNDLAISNGGKIISVINSSIYIYDMDGTFLQTLSLAAFADTLDIPDIKFDPKVVYDPVNDKFIITTASGIRSEKYVSHSRILHNKRPTWELESVHYLTERQ